jgi:hypothetical protein
MARGAWTERAMSRTEQQVVPEDRIHEHLQEKANG